MNSSYQDGHAKTRAHVIITGKVQGVFFRANTKCQADSLGVTGWVRNLADGRVEAVFEGDKEAVKSAVSYCQQGPKHAEVKKVDIKWEKYNGKFKEFQIIY